MIRVLLLCLALAMPASADTLLFAAVEQHGVHDDGEFVNTVACANLETGSFGAMPWTLSYPPAHLILDESIDGLSMVAVSNSGMGRAIGVGFYPTQTGVFPTFTLGDQPLPIAIEYAARGWKVIVGSNSIENIVPIELHRGGYDPDEGRRIRFDVRVNELDPTLGEYIWKTGRWLFVDVASRRALAVNTGFYENRWLLVDVASRSAEVLPMPWGADGQVVDVSVDLAAGLSVVTSTYMRRSTLWFYRNGGSIDPREWALLDAVASGSYACGALVLAPDCACVVTSDRTLVEYAVSDATVAPMRECSWSMLAGIRQYNFRVAHDRERSRVLVTIAPEGSIGPMCLIGVTPATGAVDTILDLRPGEPLNPDGRPWVIHDIIVTEE